MIIYVHTYIRLLEMINYLLLELDIKVSGMNRQITLLGGIWLRLIGWCKSKMNQVQSENSAL